MKTIAELADEEFKAREYLRMLSVQNVAGLDYEERRKSAIAYAEAQAKASAARAALDEAIRNHR